MIFTHDGYQLDDDASRIDVQAAWEFLSTEAYWGRGRTRDVFETQLRNSWRVVGVYEAGSGRMVGMARAVSDGGRIAYLADVYVLAGARGHGLGKELVSAMIDRGPGADFRWMLHTSDAHGLYRQFGFAEPDGTYLERPPKSLSITDNASCALRPPGGIQQPDGHIAGERAGWRGRPYRFEGEPYDHQRFGGIGAAPGSASRGRRRAVHGAAELGGAGV